jgi:hypothetical protein
VPMPKMTCPIVDIRPVRIDDDERLAQVMKHCTDQTAGVINMSGLLTGLEALGAKVTNRQVKSVRPVSPSTTLRTNTIGGVR